MVKTIGFLAIFILFQSASEAAINSFHFSNGATVFYGFTPRLTPTSPSVANSISFFNSHGKKLWQLNTGTIRAFRVDTSTPEKDRDSATVEMGKKGTRDWSFDNIWRIAYIVDVPSEIQKAEAQNSLAATLLPIFIDNAHLLVSSDGEVIPLQFSNGDNMKPEGFISAQWVQRRWTLPEGESYRLVAGLDEPKVDSEKRGDEITFSMKDPGAVKFMFMIRERNWTSQFIPVMTEEMGELLYFQGFKPYFNRDSVAFNIEDIEKSHSGLAPIKFDFDNFQPTENRQLGELVETNSLKMAFARAKVSEESGPYFYMTKDLKPYTPPAASQKLEDRVANLVKSKDNRVASYPNLIEYEQTLSRQGKRLLTVAILEDFIKLDPDQYDYEDLLPPLAEDRKAYTEHFNSVFFSALKWTKSRPRTIADLENDPEFMLNFGDVYLEVIATALARLPGAITKFMPSDFALAQRFTQMLEKLPVGFEGTKKEGTNAYAQIRKILYSYLRQARTYDRPQDRILAQSIRESLAYEGQDKILALDALAHATNAESIKKVLSRFDMDAGLLNLGKKRALTLLINDKEKQDLVNHIDGLLAQAYSPAVFNRYFEVEDCENALVKVRATGT